MPVTPRSSDPGPSSSAATAASSAALHDVLILGSGLAGTTLASILARQGHRVLVLEKGRHPRFAIGESMLPQSTMWMWILGHRFDVPEIHELSHTDTLQEKVGASCGKKRSIGFVYHREGREQDPSEAHQLVPPVLPLFAESHLFREDVDLYMLRAAQGYGAEYRDQVEVTAVEELPDRMRVTTAGGEVFEARYLVDGSGSRSVVARTFDLREEPTSLATRSRSIFTHVRGLQPYDATVDEADLPGLTRGWHEGTLHHVFDGGWLWIIPFGNHERSENTLASVGLTLDLARFPERGDDAEEEFWSVVDRLPGVRRHLEGIEAVRPWISTGRLQYSSKSAVGDRWCLLSHAYGFVDPLYSQGMINTYETVFHLAESLLPALEDDRFSRERFADLDRLQASQLASTDQMVACSYRSMGSFHTWNAWLKVWLAAKLFGDLWIFRSCVRYLALGGGEAGRAAFDGFACGRRPVDVAPFGSRVQELLNAGEALLDRMDAGELTAEEVGQALHERIAEQDWLPTDLYRWGDPEAHHLDIIPPKLMGLIGWGKTASPPWMRDGVFDFEPPMPPGMGEGVADAMAAGGAPQGDPALAAAGA